MENAEIKNNASKILYFANKPNREDIEWKIFLSKPNFFFTIVARGREIVEVFLDFVTIFSLCSQRIEEYKLIL